MNTIHEQAFEGMQNATIWQKRFSRVDTGKKQRLNNRAVAKNGLYLLLMFILLLAACSTPTAYPKAPVSGEDVIIGTLSFQPDTPQFLTYSSGNKNINLFVIKIDNEVLSFLDACLSC
jgi:hypothetical protein